MKKKDSRKLRKKKDLEQKNKAAKPEIKTKDFQIDNEKYEPISSSETINKNKAEEEIEEISLEEKTREIPPDARLISDDSASSEEIIEQIEEEIGKDDPIFQALVAPGLPRLERENRARLQIQSPTRVYFYWSLKNNPHQTLNRAFGGNAGNYRLVAKLINETRNSEEIFPVESEGSRWFDTSANSGYRAEIGFYAPNRPFIRILYSNRVETPRKNPSSQRAESADWAVSAHQFARVLDVSGFAQDAFEVAFAGDDLEFADKATQQAFSQIIGAEKEPVDSIKYDFSEVRHSLLALASGIELENLRGQISLNLYNKIRENADKLSVKNALAALEENFGEFVGETAEMLPAQVFGASLINFPRRVKRKIFPKFSPISSLKS